MIIEQAKGFVAPTRSIEPEEAFKLIRAYARSHSMNIHDVSRDVVQRRLLI